MVLNAAVQMLREADDLKLKISKFKIGTSMLQDRNIWVTQQQLQQIYQKVLVLDLDYALDKKVEQDLWNVGFKQQIEALQAISKDRKNPHRSEGQAMLTWVLQAAAGFYLCLLHQICTTFKLDLPFRRRASLLGWAEGWGAGNHTQSVTGVLPPPAAARYISQHCLVHLGDLARYRQQLRVAHTFYRHALLVSAQSGQPYNQLALVARRRGRQLDAIYWHVRSLLVRAPFPPAHTNLATTLAAAANTRTRENLPVIPGITSQPASEQNATTAPSRLDAHNYVEEFIKAVHIIHTLEDLDAASQLVNVLNSSLTPLVATDSFECMTLIKLGCVVMWLIHTNTEGLTLDSSQLTEGEYRAGNMSLELAAGSLLALLLPAYTRELNKPAPSLPALKVWLQWLLAFPSVLKSAALVSRPQLWAALAHTLNQLCEYTSGFDDKIYATLPLPEDEELHGFLPLESAFSTLKFTNYASWDTYGDRLPAYPKHLEEEGQDEDIFSLRCPSDMTEETLSKQPELEQKIRACRIINIGIVIAKQIETNGHDHFTVVKEEDRVSFNTSNVDSEELTAALYELSVQQTAQNESDELHPPPIIISEADFREKVREKRVGILKPQGSLERAREERALATQDDQDVECDDTSGDEAKKECRKARMNVAMAAIMRKQEETNKQVKFVTPATTPDLTSDVSPPKEDKLKILQPKAIKSLADIPVGRKTGGILSLKDRSAGYPHLVNAEPENKVIIDEDKKHDVKSQTIQNPPKLSQEHIMPNRMPNFIPRPSFQPKTVYPKINFNSTYQPNNNVSNQGIRLPVVNPKEIDVRSAAVQKQNSRQDLFQDGPKFNYQNMSGDKKNFLNDLPPRFANQYKYWQQQNNQNDNHFNTNQDNKFSDDNFRTNLQANHNWTPTGQQEYPQPTWWKLPENFNTNYSPMNFQPNYYQANLSPNFQSSPNYTQSDNATSTNYMGNLTQPQLQNLQIPSNFSSPMNSFGTYGGTVGYDSTMYPQFANSSGFPQMKMPEKPSGLNFSPGASSGEPKRVSMFNEPVMKNIEHGPITDRSGAGQGNTYSLFSAQDNGNWAPPQMQQSLWSGPGPSPLERLLEQQKQVKPPNEPQ